jgi:hypothetical protein
MAHVFKRFDYRYGPSFMLAMPELWEGWTTDQWTRLFRLGGPRPKPQLMFLDGYGDIQFFLQWLALDPFPLLTPPAAIGRTDLKRVVKHCLMHAPMLVQEPWHLQAMDEIWGCTGHVEHIRRRLIAEEAALGPCFTKYETFREYVRSVQGQLYPTTR